MVRLSFRVRRRVMCHHHHLCEGRLSTWKSGGHLLANRLANRFVRAQPHHLRLVPLGQEKHHKIPQTIHDIHHKLAITTHDPTLPTANFPRRHPPFRRCPGYHRPPLRRCPLCHHPSLHHYTRHLLRHLRGSRHPPFNPQQHQPRCLSSTSHSRAPRLVRSPWCRRRART